MVRGVRVVKGVRAVRGVRVILYKKEEDKKEKVRKDTFSRYERAGRWVSLLFDRGLRL